MQIHIKVTLAVVGSFVLSLTTAITASAAHAVRMVPVPHGGEPACARVDSEGTIHLLLNSAEGPKYAKSTDHGETFSEAIGVTDPKSHQSGLEFSAWDLVVEGDGYVHVAMGTNAWKLKLPEEEWAFFYARLEPGEYSFSPVQNVNRTPSEGFSLAADGKGTVTACWLSGKLYANVSRDHGKTFAPAVEIDPAFDPCDCCTTSAVYGADGKLAILYREETDNQRDMYLALWDQERQKVSRTRVSSTLWTIDGCPMSYYSVSRNRNGFVAVWPTKEVVYFARLNGEGELQSPPEVKTPGRAGMRSGMLALTAADGSTLLAWKKDHELSWQIYDKRGRPLGPPESTPSAGSGVAGVLGKAGEFVLFR